WAARPRAQPPRCSCCCSCTSSSSPGAPSSPSSCPTTPSSASTRRWSRASSSPWITRSSPEATMMLTATWRTPRGTSSTGKPRSSTTASRTGLRSRVFISFASVMSFPPSLIRPSTSTFKWAMSPPFSQTWGTGSQLSPRIPALHQYQDHHESFH
ncbi:transmembrane emp24 domain-containing protein 3 isoform b precursor, partial [Daubentonia madagascariensis]